MYVFLIFPRHSMEGNEKVAHEEVENNLGDVEGDSKKKKRTQKRYQEVFRGPEEPEMEDDYSRGLVVGKPLFGSFHLEETPLLRCCFFFLPCF